ncbi:MAG: methyl-accepting chemotaxis protein [Betaproteobacteria bacterium]|uniref:Methyl-accepting chemotaxis protein n=1 Tax=Candidatus Proximibacter danicus TaxID=2954365 RepID=A0A9D7K1L2_9PROT|nr:methyl-accepting chemotaxis protein [Candidatus Proximibacter danicus]MBK9446468.1 methyl-accepting chemotaxis protein [Betaproteobacteria bacterium]
MNSLAWKIRAGFLALAGLAAGILIFGPGVFGSGNQGLAIGAAALFVIAIFLAMMLEGALVRRLQEQRAVIESIYMDGDLTRRVPESGGDEIAATAAAFNKLMASISTIIGKVFFNSVEVARASSLLIQEANTVAAGSNQQRDAALAAASAMNQLTERMHQVSANASDTAQIAESASGLSAEGMVIVQKASAEMEKIAASVTQSSEVVCILGERSKAISGIVQTIREIADQTNLLALNAAIEAARAGEQGRGFAVVADEVRKLAERTSQATGEISSMISAIQGETQSAIVSIAAGTGQAKNGADLAQQAADSLERINRGARGTMEKVDAIAAAIDEQSRSGQDIADHVRSIMSMAEANSTASEKALREADQLEYLATNLKEIGNVFKLGAAGEQAVQTHARMPPIVQRAAIDIGAILDKAIDSGRIRLEDMFDQNYQPIANTKPPKFKTKFDDLTDQVLIPLQEQLLDQNKWLVYAIACDRKGYVPTHNKRFAQPLSGDEKVDFVNNRTKRVFDDPVGKRCGDHRQPFLLQTYRRDTGEIMHDISAPVMVKGRHWGGFRIGYKTEV